MKEPGSHWTDFHEIWYSIILKNLSKKIKFQVTRPMYIDDNISLKWEMSETKLYRKLGHILCTITFPENCADNVEK